MGGAKVGSQSQREKEFHEPIIKEGGRWGNFLVHSVVIIYSAVLTAGPVGCLTHKQTQSYSIQRILTYIHFLETHPTLHLGFTLRCHHLHRT